MADSVKMGTIIDNELYSKSISDIDMGAIIHCSKDFEPDYDGEGMGGDIFTTQVEFSEGSTFNISQTYDELVAKVDSGRQLTFSGGFRYSRDNDENGWVYYPFVFNSDILFGQVSIHWNAETCFAYYGLSDVDNMMTIEEFRALPDDAEITISGTVVTKKQILDSYSEQLTSVGLPQDFIEATSLTIGADSSDSEKGMLKYIISGGCDVANAFNPSLYIYGPQDGEDENTIHVALGDSLSMRFLSMILG